ncbi:MAG: recombination-associated protein RdgC [Myxococcaceae bacterium]
MPILRGSVTFSRFRVERSDKTPSDERRWLARGLQAHAFEPIDRKGDEDRATGFVELEHGDKMEFAVGDLFYGERALFAFRVDVIRVSAATVRDELLRWATAFENEHGRKPARGEKTEAKAGIRQKLRNRATELTKLHDVAWNLKSDQVQIWSSSRKQVDEITAAVESAFSVKLSPLVPGAMALSSGVDEDALQPTAELVGGELEVSHGAA